jgi:hypothetical protein
LCFVFFLEVVATFAQICQEVCKIFSH